MPSIFDDTVELRHLRYFQAVAERGSFTRAAAAIGLRQPTVSHQIHQLEVALGEVLFQRGRSTTRLTAAGELLLPYARRVLGEMDALRHGLDDLTGLRRGSLTVAVLPVLAERILPRALALFRRAHPGIQVRILEMSVDDMARELAAGSVGMCIGVVDTSLPVRKTHVLFEEELVAVVDVAMACDGRGSLTVAELARHSVIVPPAGFGTRTLILQAWARARRAPTFVMEANSTELVLQTIAAGGGVGVLPASALWGRRPEGWALLRIVRSPLKRRVGVWQAQVGKGRPAADALLPFLRQAVNECHADSPGPAGAVVLPGA